MVSIKNFVSALCKDLQANLKWEGSLSVSVVLYDRLKILFKSTDVFISREKESRHAGTLGRLLHLQVLPGSLAHHVADFNKVDFTMLLKEKMVGLA